MAEVPSIREKLTSAIQALARVGRRRHGVRQENPTTVASQPEVQDPSPGIGEENPRRRKKKSVERFEENPPPDTRFSNCQNHTDFILPSAAQSKLPVVLAEEGATTGARIALPLDGTPSTHILKPEPARFPGLVANEAWCLDLAREVGLRVAECHRRIIGKTPCLIVKRYDRARADDGGTRRLHPEHFKQLSTSAHLSWPMVRERLTEMTERIVEACRRPDKSHTDAAKTVSEAPGSIVMERAERMLRLARKRV